MGMRIESMVSKVALIYLLANMFQSKQTIA